MIICPNCHKLCSDEDFCIHCGAAVYPDNCCLHEHDGCITDLPDEGKYAKQLQKSTPYSAPAPSAANTAEKKKNSGCGCTVFIIIVIILISVLSEMDSDQLEYIWYSIVDFFESL